MQQILLNTTGSVSSVTINDLGGRTFTHPETNFDLLTEFTIEKIRDSFDLQDHLTAGRITLTDDASFPIFNLKDDLANAKLQFDRDRSNVIDNSQRLNNQQEAYYLDRTNHTGTQPASSISNFNDAVQNVANNGTSGYALVAGYSHVAGVANDALLLNGQDGNYYLDFDNHTGNLPASRISDFYAAMRLGTADHASTAGYVDYSNVSVAHDNDVYKTQKDFINLMHSAGIITGGTFTPLTAPFGTNGTDGQAGYYQVAGGIALIRESNSPTANLKLAKFEGAVYTVVEGISLLSHVGVVYENGAAHIQVRPDSDWNYNNEIPLGSAVLVTGTTVLFNNPYRVDNAVHKIIQRFRGQDAILRDNSAGGIILSDIGNRYLNLTAGAIFVNLDRKLIPARDTSTTGVFTTAYFNGIRWVFNITEKQWPNLYYNDLNTGLVTMTDDYYSNLWFYVSAGANGGLIQLYGQSQHANYADAYSEISPSATLPTGEDFNTILLLIGRIIFKKGSNTPEIVQSAFADVLSFGQNHNTLRNLQGGNQSELYHFTQAEHSGLLDVLDTNVAQKNVLRVSKDPGFGEFATIEAALASITDNDENNPYTISVGPGVYEENELACKPFVSIVGSAIQTTIIKPLGDHDLFHITDTMTELSFLTIIDVPVGHIGVFVDNCGNFAQMHKISFENCDTCVYLKADTNEAWLFMEYVDYNGIMSFGTVIESANNFLAYCNAENYYTYPESACIANKVFGERAGLIMRSGFLQGVGEGEPGVTPPFSGSKAIEIFDGASVATNGMEFFYWDVAVDNVNAGTPALVNLASSVFFTNNIDIRIDHPNTFGGFLGVSIRQKVLINPANTLFSPTFLSANPFDNGITIVGRINSGATPATVTDISTLFTTDSMGLLFGGDLAGTAGTAGMSFRVNALAGTGYLEIDNFEIKKMQWTNMSVELLPNVTKYLYITQNGLLATSDALPDVIKNILLGRVRTHDTGIEYIENSPIYTYRVVNNLIERDRQTMGVLYATGSIVTENVTPRHLNVSAGKYFYTGNTYQPAGGTDIIFTIYYRDGVGGWIRIADQQEVPNDVYDDGSGVLANLTTDWYAKHLLITVGDGVLEKYFLILAQEQYETINEVESAALPILPTWFSTSATPKIASIIVREGETNIVNILSERPQLGSVASGASGGGITNHGDLTGLENDDHLQYLLTSGVREMSGDINMDNNAITNVTTINGIVPQTHGSRHLPNGADPLTVATPVTVGTANAEGIANALSRADHVHAHGLQTNPAHHAVATISANGFMSSTDKTKLDALNSTLYLLLDGTQAMIGDLNMNNHAINNITSVAANTISANSITSGNIAASGNISTNSNLNILGNVNINGTLYSTSGIVAGGVTSLNTVIASGNITGNNITSLGNINSNTVTTHIVGTDTLHVNGDAYVNGTLYSTSGVVVNGDVNISGTYRINGAAIASTAQTLTNKTIDANNNTITNIADDEIAAHTSTKISITNKGQLNSAIVYNDQANVIGDFDQTIRSSRLKITNPANNANYTFVGAAIAADRSVTLPLLTGNDTFVTEAFTQTLTNKTINASSNTISNIVDVNIGTHTSTKISITAKGQLNSAIVYNDQANVYGAFDQTFRSGNFKVTNPANTFNYSIVGSAIAAARNVTLPLLTGNDVFVTEAFTQTLTNKTIDAVSNTISNIADANIATHTSTKISITNKGQLNSAIVYNDQANVFGDFTQTFRSGRLLLANASNTFNYSFIGAAIAADRSITLPLLTTGDTMVTEAFTQTLTNKTINASNNTISNIVDANIGVHTSTKISITNKGQLNSAIAYTDQANVFGDFDQTFRSSRLLVTNPANTFSYNFTGAAIAANRTITLPLLTTGDTLVTEAFAQSLTNKTINASNNTITNIVDANIGAHTSTKITITNKGQLNSAIDYNDQANVKGDFDQTFRSGRLLVTNPANTFSYNFTGSAIAANRTITLPLLTNGSDTMVTENFIQTLTNKTINASSNTISNIVDVNIGTHTSTKISITAKGQLNSAIVYNDQANVFGDFDQTLRSNRLIIRNPANTFGYSVTAAAIAANRVLTLPLLTANDTFVTEAFTQTLTNKTITDNTNNVAANSLKTAGSPVNVAAAAAPTTGQFLIATSATTATWQNIFGAEQSASGSTAITNTTYGTGGANLVHTTPAAGTYLVMWSANVAQSNNGVSVFAAPHVGGTIATNSERTFTRAAAGANTIGGSTIVTANGSQNIDLRFRVSANTGTITGRSIQIIRLGT